MGNADQWALNLQRIAQIDGDSPVRVGLPFEVLPDGRVRNLPWAEYAVVDERTNAHCACSKLEISSTYGTLT
jgi:hypothetical protein